MNNVPTAEEFLATLKSLGLSCQIDRMEDKYPLVRYYIKMSPNSRLSKLEELAEDIALQSRPVAPPVIRPSFADGLVIVEMMFGEHPVFKFDDIFAKHPEMALPMLMGTKDITDPVFRDLAKMPHMIVAGSTGSGKSMLLHSIIKSMINASSDVGIKLALIDPKLVEFSRYSKSSALLYPVINDGEGASDMLDNLIEEMNSRYKVFQKYSCRDIAEYRERVKRIPYIVLVIDELADPIRIRGFERRLCELAQKSRAAGIHIVAATQHPSSKVLTGEIRANFPSKVALKVSTAVHSRVVLDRSGAENLLGKGDAILVDESGDTIRFRGPYVPNNSEVKKAAATTTSKPTFMSKLLARIS